MNVKELFGKEVLDVNAKMIGKVIDMDFDTNQGIITHIVVKAGAIQQYDVRFDNIAKIGDRIILNIGEGELKRKTVIRM
jgi:sporulation protein YlmC with PRC-barrel domain